jgi:hypothetical protein
VVVCSFQQPNTTPHWHRENRRGYPTPMATGGTELVFCGTGASGGNLPPIMSAATAVDDVFQKDMETSEAEEESSCTKGCSKEAFEARVDAKDAWAWG